MKDSTDNVLKARRGEGCNNKLSADDVRKIRVNRHGLTAKQWAEKLNVHYRTIEKIRYYETWRHL